MRYHSWLSAACSLVLSLSACQQEAVAPEQQISGRYALDNNGTTDTYLDFNTGRLTIYKSDEAYPLAEHKIWDCNEDFFKADEASNYSITDGVLVSSWENFGKVEFSEDKLLMQGKTYLELKGFESGPYSVIRPSKERLDLTYAAETVELAINVENALPAWSLKAETKTEWISDLKVESNVLRFKTSSTATDRSGVIELKYPHAETVSLPVSQKPSTFIKPSSESLTLGYEASSQTLGYTIENPIAGSTLNATTVALWISDIQISDTQISFKLSENNSGADRSSSFSLSYGGAPNVIVAVTQKWSASSFTLTPASQESAYTGGSFSFDFAVNNPRADVNVVAASQANWITDVAVSGNKVTYKVAENNSGALRTGKIKLTYGSYATAEFNVTQKGTPVNSLSLNKSSLALHTGNSEKLVATVEPSDATLAWSSSNTSVATVSNDGTVTAKGNGLATITVSATDGSGKNANCTVTVTTLVSSITLNKTTLALHTGKSSVLIATVSPSTTSNKNLTWSSSNTSVATVISDGTVTATGNGTATITVSSTDGSGKNAKCTVTVTTLVNSISLNKTSLNLYKGDSFTLSATVYPSTASNKSLNWTSSNTSIATVGSNGSVTAKGIGSATITASAADGSGQNAKCTVTVSNRPLEAIDMGTVVNGKNIKWASFNVGASAPEEYGDYYSWGETSTKSDYSWGNYKWCNGSENTLTKYNTDSSHGNVDNRTVLITTDDAAYVKLGSSWRMPTDAEWTALRETCNWTWTTQNGVNGYKVVSPNGNSIFLPAAGFWDDNGLSDANSGGYYWSSSLRTGYPIKAWLVYFSSSSIERQNYRRSHGRSVRAVYTK